MTPPCHMSGLVFKFFLLVAITPVLVLRRDTNSATAFFSSGPAPLRRSSAYRRASSTPLLTQAFTPRATAERPRRTRAFQPRCFEVRAHALRAEAGRARNISIFSSCGVDLVHTACIATSPESWGRKLARNWLPSSNVMALYAVYKLLRRTFIYQFIEGSKSHNI